MTRLNDGGHSCKVCTATRAHAALVESGLVFMNAAHIASTESSLLTALVQLVFEVGVFSQVDALIVLSVVVVRVTHNHAILLVVEDSSMATSGAHGVIHVVEPHEQDLVQMLLRLGYVSPNALQVVSAGTADPLAPLPEETSALNFIFLIDLLVRFMLLQQRFSELGMGVATSSLTFR